MVDATETQANPASAAMASIEVKNVTLPKPTIQPTATITVNALKLGDFVALNCPGSDVPYNLTYEFGFSETAVVEAFSTISGLIQTLNQNGPNCNFTAQPSGANSIVLTYANLGAGGGPTAANISSGGFAGDISVTPWTEGQVGHAADAVTVGGVTFTASPDTTCASTDTTGCTDFSSPATLATAITRDQAQTGAVAAVDPNKPDAVDLTATTPGSAGNTIGLAATNPADDVVTPFKGGSDGTPATYVLVFSQAMNPSTFRVGAVPGMTAAWNTNDTAVTVTASPTLASILPAPGQPIFLGASTIMGENGRALVSAGLRTSAPVSADRAVALASSLGLLSGMKGLSPSESVTRAQAVDAVAAVLGLSENSTDPYTDLTGRVDAGLIAAAQADGLMAGWADPSNGVTTFAPDGPITRADLAVLATNALGLGAEAAAMAVLQTDEEKYTDLRAAGLAALADMVLMMSSPTSVVPPLSATSYGPMKHVTVQTLALALVRLWRLLDVPTAITPTATLSTTTRGEALVSWNPGVNAVHTTVPNPAWETTALTLPYVDSGCTIAANTVTCPPGVHTVDLTVTVPGSEFLAASGQATFTVPKPPPPPPPAIQVTNAVETAGSATPATALLDVYGVQPAVAAQPATTATATITLTNPQPNDTITWTDAQNALSPIVVTLTDGVNFSNASTLATAINGISDPNVGTATATGSTVTIPWATAGSVGNSGPVTITTSDPTGIVISPFSGGADATAAISADTVTVGTKTLTAGVDFSTPLGLATAITTDQSQTGAIATYDATTQQISLTATAYGSAGNGQTLSVSSQVQDIVLVNGFQGGTQTPPKVSLTFGAPIDQTTLTSANFASVLTPSTGNGFGSGATGAWNTTGTPGTVFTVTLGTGTFLPAGTTIAIAASVAGAQGQAVGSPTPTVTVPLP